MTIIDQFKSLTGGRIDPISVASSRFEPIEVNPGDLPTTIDMSPSKFVSFIAVAFFVISFFALAAARDGSLIGYAPAILFLLVSVFLVIKSRATIQVEFREDGVHVRHETPLGEKSWSAFYSQFNGLRHYSKTIGTERRTTRYQIVELVHKNPNRSLPVYIDTGGWDGRQKLENYAKSFHLPILEESGEQKFRRVGDLDKSISELNREQSRATEKPSNGPQARGKSLGSTPNSFSIEALREDGQVVEYITIHATGRIVFGTIKTALFLFFVSIPFLLGGIGIIIKGYIVFAVLMLGFLSLFWFLVLFARLHHFAMPNRIRIEPGEKGSISLIKKQNVINSMALHSLPKNKIEEISVLPINKQHALKLVADSGEMQIALPLAKSHYEWLRTFLVSKL